VRRAFFFWRWDAGKDGRERGKREREDGGWRRREEKMGFFNGNTSVRVPR
jgi:hypothetical protein